MNSDRWQQIQEILDTAGEVPKERRQAVVAEACAGNTELQQEVETLLVLDDEVDDFIEEPLWHLNRSGDAGPGDQAGAARPRRIGHYRIERPLGRGGMGEVFLAVREDDYEQRVALKLLHEGTSRADLLTRFYTERQILASLQHPGIARLLDGGALKDGRPYFVMEYVEGEPITRYCTSRGLSVRERLELFRLVCAAVHFAHQNLVVHRDLKASNILVTAEGEPRLLDFGIAKLLQTGPVAGPAVTMPGLIPMTPANASPEQILDEPITTACDIYALGVLLYRLLADRPPYHIERNSFAALVQVICLDEPKKPSAAVLEAKEPPPDEPNKVSTGFEDIQVEDLPRRPSPGAKRRLHRRLLGDLDAIVMKAMRKEPNQRYGSAAALAEDIRHHLVGLPVKALRGNWFYYTKKFVRRNKLALVALLLIVGFAITATVQAFRASKERAQAERNQVKAERVTEFLTNLFESADPDATRGTEVSVREILERARERFEGELADEPEIRAEIWGTLGGVYHNLGLYPEALKFKEKALASWREFSSEDDPELADHINNLARVLRETGSYAKAEDHYRQALEMRERLGQGPRKIAFAKKNLATALMSQGKDNEAELLLLEVLKIRRGLRENNDSILYSLGVLYLHRGDFPNAEARLQEALELRIRAKGHQQTGVALIRGTQGQVFHGQGRLAMARESFEKALELLRRFLADDHLKVAKVERGFAALLLDLGESSEARRLAENALEVLRRSKQERDWMVADAESVLGHCFLAEGNYRAAEEYLLSSYSMIRTVRGDNNYFTHKALQRIIQLYEVWGQDEKAAKYRKILQTSAFQRTANLQSK